jgi:hypothetical protein
MGCALIVVGLLFAPVIIGIFILLYGISVYTEKQWYLSCPNCGYSTPDTPYNRQLILQHGQQAVQPGQHYQA